MEEWQLCGACGTRARLGDPLIIWVGVGVSPGACAGRPLTERELDVAMESMDADGSGGIDIDEFTDWYLAMKKKGQMPSWAGGMMKLQNKLRTDREKRRSKQSIASRAAQDQGSVMAMRGR
eukprot:COSAG01_NODE_7354_length_3239_cov_2.627707_2_plen_121_part_00